MSSYDLYCKLERLCIEYNLITQEQSDIITRKGHRKHGLWKRHILDLCDFVLWKIEDQNIENEELQKLLENSIKWCLRKVT